MNRTEDKLIDELLERARNLMADWPSSRNKQRQFIMNYLGNGFSNATQAAIRAGYSDKSARKTASNMLHGGNKYVHIKDTVNELKNAFDEAKEKMSIADATEIMQYWTRVVRGEVTEHKLPPGGKTVVEVPPSIVDRNKAGELLLKTSGEMKEQVEFNGNMNVGSFDGLTEDELRKLANLGDD